MVRLTEDEFLLELEKKSNKELDNLENYYANQAEAARGPRSDTFLDEVMKDFSERQIDTNLMKFERTFRIHNARSEKAKIADESKRAPLTGSIEQYADSPDRLDFEGVDTPAAEPAPSASREIRIMDLMSQGLTRKEAENKANAERLQPGLL